MTESVIVRGSDGNFISIDKPCGFFCQRCDGGVSVGMNYFPDKAALRGAIQESPKLKEVACGVVKRLL